MTNPTEQILEALKYALAAAEARDWPMDAKKYREALAAMQGMVLVPVEPTTESLKGMFDCDEYAPWSDLYAAMIAPYVNKEEG